VTVEVRSSASGEMGVWTALGCASTVTHGYYLIITGPMWLATGITSAVGESRSSHAKAENQSDFGRLYQFARFPQGLPIAIRTQKWRVPSAASADGAPAGSAPSLPGTQSADGGTRPTESVDSGLSGRAFRPTEGSSAR
jgi:hypothetical protein